MNIIVDRSYRTGLDTAFYDRVEELGFLRRIIDTHRLTVMYGPRNVGKSELARYLLRSMNTAALRVDARLLSVKDLAARTSVEVLGRITPSRIVDELVEDVVEALVPGGRILNVALSLASALRQKLSGSMLLLVDEFHELPGYRGERGRQYYEALDDLRSLAAYLAKNMSGVRVMVTVSEGFAATWDAWARLEGYSTRWVLVEHLDQEHFKALYDEYRSKHGCRLGLKEIYALVGGTPGALPDLCPLPREDLVEARVTAWLGEVETALSIARSRLEAEGASITPVELVKETLILLREPVKPLRNPQRHILGQTLVEQNVLYPKIVPGGIHYRPQYPIYQVIILEAARKEVESLLDLDPGEVYDSAVYDEKA